ncbi:sensor domain-containing protein [Cohnella faecalis]|uniref:Putative sensor domain-containing protein n=1 Tax=Cohnella faecalis TaxID=2315694 RepID=A0A398CVG6_9BACL|nr:sensor domain-containing protein [Cohnella faecalis]RIE04518.1 hypothetical protein D3H35_05800 [Cohnella faecalis]
MDDDGDVAAAGIAVFVIAIVGVCVGLPLAPFIIGLPILAATLKACERLMSGERKLAATWDRGEAHDPEHWEAQAAQSNDSERAATGWRSWIATLGRVQNYRGLLFGVAQLPATISAFTLAIVIPATFAGIALTPLAYLVSDRVFSFELFGDDWLLNRVFTNLTPENYSYIIGGIGLVLLLLTPYLIRRLGRMYAAWIRWIAGEEKAIDVSEPHGSAGLAESYQ